MAIAILLADQFTKILIISTYQLGEGFAVTSFFNIVRVHNEGAAFSFLANAGGWQRWLFTSLGVIAAIALWGQERAARTGRGVPVYFIGVGEAVEDLQTFDAQEFAQALLQ